MASYAENVSIWWRHHVIRYAPGLYMKSFPLYLITSWHGSLDYLLSRLFRRRSKKSSKLCITGHCEGNSPVTPEFPTQRASNTENVSIWWRHHAYNFSTLIILFFFFQFNGTCDFLAEGTCKYITLHTCTHTHTHTFIPVPVKSPLHPRPHPTP